jgi:hypothetical protein
VSHLQQHLEHFLWWFINSKEIIGTGICAIIAAAAGAYIGGRMATRAALRAQEQAAKDQRQRDAEADRRAVDGILRAVSAEMKVFKGHILDNMEKMFGTRDEIRERFGKNSTPLAMTPIEPNRFRVFDSNCGLLGRLEDEDLLRRIIALYTNAKGLVDHLNVSARGFERWQQLTVGDEERQFIDKWLDKHEKQIRTGVPKPHRQLDEIVDGIAEYLKHSGTIGGAKSE